MANKLRAIAKAIKELTYDETMEIAVSLRNAVRDRIDDDDMNFQVGSHTDWADLLHSWAEGALNP
jgi:hypothetical protein